MNSRNFELSEEYMQRARRVIPRGVNSAKRSGLRPFPLAFASARGSRVRDIDGNELVDYVGAYGPMLLGHQSPPVMDAVRRQLDLGVSYGGQHEGESELAERLIRLVPSAESVLLCTTGTEADQAAIRIARAHTGRRKIVKFEGHYHGWIGSLTVNGPGTRPGVGSAPRQIISASYNDVGRDVLVCPWNDEAALESLLSEHGSDVAAVIMEPIAVNGGNLEADDGYLAAARRLCDTYGCLLLFDEVITGFRIAPGGAQQEYGVTPDLTVLAKAIASGFPLSAVVGRRGIMSSADQVVAHAGTYNGNAVSVAAANATLEILEHHRGTIYPKLERFSADLADGIEARAAERGAPLKAKRAGSILRLHWGAPSPLRTYADAQAGDTTSLGLFSAEMVRRGFHVRENGLLFVSAAHTDDDLHATLMAVEESLDAICVDLRSGMPA